MLETRPPCFIWLAFAFTILCNGQPMRQEWCVTTKNEASQEILTQFWRSLASRTSNCICGKWARGFSSETGPEVFRSPLISPCHYQWINRFMESFSVHIVLIKVLMSCDTLEFFLYLLLWYFGEGRGLRFSSTNLNAYFHKDHIKNFQSILHSRRKMTH